MHRRRRPEGDAGVDVVKAHARGAGGHVGNARLHAHAIARLEALHFGPDLDHRAGRLVSQHHGRLDDERTDAAVRVIVHVAAADAHRVDGDLHIARAELQRQIDVAKGQASLLLQNQGAHALLLSLPLKRPFSLSWRRSRRRPVSLNDGADARLHQALGERAVLG